MGGMTAFDPNQQYGAWAQFTEDSELAAATEAAERQLHLLIPADFRRLVTQYTLMPFHGAPGYVAFKYSPPRA